MNTCKVCGMEIDPTTPEGVNACARCDEIEKKHPEIYEWFLAVIFKHIEDDRDALKQLVATGFHEQEY